MSELENQNTPTNEQLLENLIEKFIGEYVNNRYDFAYFNAAYGKEIVESWLKDPIIKRKIHERSKLPIDEFRIEQWNNFKIKANDVIAKCLRGDLGEKEQAHTARWILSGESAYFEAVAKIRGERAGHFAGKEIGKPDLRPVIFSDEKDV